MTKVCKENMRQAVYICAHDHLGLGLSDSGLEKQDDAAEHLVERQLLGLPLLAALEEDDPFVIGGAPRQGRQHARHQDGALVTGDQVGAVARVVLAKLVEPLHLVE